MSPSFILLNSVMATSLLAANYGYAADAAIVSGKVKVVGYMAANACKL